MYLFLVANNLQQPTGSGQNFKEYLRNLSIFPSAPPLIDKYERRTQRISTILFILLFIASMTVIIVYSLPLKITIPYTNIGTMVKTVVIEKPSLAMYAQLYSVFPQTLECPCSKASINYAKFINIKYVFHQVCNSIFVHQSWINYLRMHSESSILKNDFRSTGSSTFQALRTFCQLSQYTIMDGLNRFYSNQYVSTSLTPSRVLEAEMTSLINQFQSSMANSFSLSLTMIRDMIQANALFSGLETNYNLRIVNDAYVSTAAHNYHGCSCASSPTCITQASIYDPLNNIPLFSIPGLYTGCYVTEALLRSNLKCFYNQTCIDRIQSYLTSSSPVQVTALNASLPSPYSIYSTIQELVDNLMIDQWNISHSYERYYDECQPSQCTGGTNDIIHIIIVLLAIIGGLSTVLRCVVPLLVRPIMFCFGKQRTSVIPEMSPIRA